MALLFLKVVYCSGISMHMDVGKGKGKSYRYRILTRNFLKKRKIYSKTLFQNNSNTDEYWHLHRFPRNLLHFVRIVLSQTLHGVLPLKLKQKPKVHQNIRN